MKKRKPEKLYVVKCSDGVRWSFVYYQTKIKAEQNWERADRYCDHTRVCNGKHRIVEFVEVVE